MSFLNYLSQQKYLPSFEFNYFMKPWGSDFNKLVGKNKYDKQLS